MQNFLCLHEKLCRDAGHFCFLGTKVRLICYGMMKQVLHLGYINSRLSKSPVTLKYYLCFVNTELYERLMYIRSFSKRHLSVIMGTLLLVIIGSVWLNTAPFRSGFEITDELGGNIFPSSILSVATTDAQVIVPVDSMYVGNPKSCIAVRVRSRNAYSRVRVEVAETPFFSRSVSEFVLAKPRTEYIIYPDIIWNYEALKNNNQAEPISVAVW
mgnify:CR=1 FL=1